ncbi:MAG: HD domain-containing protein, partial [Spirochaetota bacterium]|nr:HD domain-containing protein [Spirochaetota bacterium]
ERKKAESSLKYKLKTDDLLNTISTYFINLPSKDISDGLEHSVQAIGEFTQVDMSFLYIFNHAELNLKTYSWISTSFADSPSYLKIVSKDSIDIIKTNLSTDKLINISTLNPDADISTELYDLLRSNNIKSIIIIPVQENKKLLGFLGLCMIREVKSWKKDDISMLKLIAEVFVNALSRTTSERALKESESKFRHIFDSSPVMMHSTDNLGNINDVNNIWLSEMGYTKDEVIGKKLDEFMTEDSALKHHSVSLPSFAEYGYISKAEIKLVRKDNFKMDTLLNANMISDSSGKKMNLFVIRNITDQKRAEDEKNHSIKMLFQAMEDTIAAIAMTIEVRDPYTAGHQRRVAELAVAIAKEMNFSKDKIEGVRLAGTIHDIGKIYLPSEILSRPGRISNIEKNLLKTHAQVGYDILKPINFPWPIATMVHQHHEKLDGSGYPNGLKGEEIILEAKIICVADVVESMASHRPYRASLGIDRALDEIISHKDILYDKEVVEACVTLFRVKHYTLE